MVRTHSSYPPYPSTSPLISSTPVLYPQSSGLDSITDFISTLTQEAARHFQTQLRLSHFSLHPQVLHLPPGFLPEFSGVSLTLLTALCDPKWSVWKAMHSEMIFHGHQDKVLFSDHGSQGPSPSVSDSLISYTLLSLLFLLSSSVQELLQVGSLSWEHAPFRWSSRLNLEIITSWGFPPILLSSELIIMSLHFIAVTNNHMFSVALYNLHFILFHVMWTVPNQAGSAVPINDMAFSRQKHECH